ncbi:MAG TPA: hypothetical protein PLY87_22760 [Planctomycetaceae bacterium]|nr:hypothetical protein [Planctomycetaceae bacterium]HQZ67937.1 hypothetical protein [Planctomycetaceae bacterium]
MRRLCFSCHIMFAVLLLQSATAFSQISAIDGSESSRRTLDIEVLIQSQTSHRVKAQEWGRVLQDLGYSVKFREARAGESPGVEDRDSGDLLSTHIVAAMAPDGSIGFGNYRFAIESPQPLTLLLEEIRRYGANGPPNASPTWGLTDEQFKEVTQLLAQPVRNAVELQSPVLAIESIGLPDNMRLKFTDAARGLAISKRPVSAPDSLELQTVSRGTAIAIVLAQYGLGFRPKCVAPGRYDLEIDRGNEASNLWPVGWKPEQSFSEILPAYFKAIPLDVEDVETGKLIGAVAEKLQLPFFSAAYALDEKGLHIDTLKYTRKDARISPARLLTAVGDKLDLGFDVRVDEAGKMFLWVTTADDTRAFRHRFAHVRAKTE